MTKEQKDDLVSFICGVLFVSSFIGVVGYNSYELYKYNKAEKQQKELKQKQASFIQEYKQEHVK